MGGDGDAAVNVTDDEIQFFVGFSQGFGVNGCDALLVKYVGLGPAVKPGNAGGPGVVPQLVHVGGVCGVHAAAVFPAQLPGQHDPQLGGVVAAAHVRSGVLHQLPVDLHDPGTLRIGAAAPAHEHIDILRGNPPAAQKFLDDAAAHGQLVVGGGVLQQHRGIVEDALGEAVYFVFEVAYLGGGGAGVDDEHFDCLIHIET